jgi:hypothetical protein
LQQDEPSQHVPAPKAAAVSANIIERPRRAEVSFFIVFLQTEIEIESHGDDRQRSWADRNFLNQKDADAQVQAGLRRLPAHGFRSE